MPSRPSRGTVPGMACVTRSLPAALALLLSAAGCTILPPGSTGAAPAPASADPAPIEDAPRPPWVHHAPFSLTSSAAGARVFATAHAPLPGGNDCADAQRVLEIAASRARSEVIRAIEGEGAVAAGTLQGAETVAAWLDRPGGAVHVLVAAPSRSADRVPAGEPSWAEGERPSGVSARIITAERARFDAAGVCKDPHRRADFPCCGPVDQMCHDPARFDTQVPPRCACGENRAPCLQDFACESGQCVCRGSACPCDILKCRVGQTCGDGRCY